MKPAAFLSALMALTMLPSAPASATPPPPPAVDGYAEERVLVALEPFVGDWRGEIGGPGLYTHAVFRRIARITGMQRLIMTQGVGEPGDRHASYLDPMIVSYDRRLRLLFVAAPEENYFGCPGSPRAVDLDFDGQSTLSWQTTFCGNGTTRIERSTLQRVGDKLVETNADCPPGQPCKVFWRAEYTRVGPVEFGFHPERWTN